MKYPIKLGKKMSAPIPVSREDGDAKDEMFYPELTLTWEDDYELPESGTMTVRFKKVAESNTMRRGESNQTVTLEVHEIVSVNKKKAANKEPETGDVLDKLRDDAEKEVVVEVVDDEEEMSYI